MAELIARIDETTGDVSIFDSSTGEPIRVDLESQGISVDRTTGAFINNRTNEIVSINYDPLKGYFDIQTIRGNDNPSNVDDGTSSPGDNPNPDNPNPPINGIVDANADFLKRNKVAPTFKNVTIQRGGNNGAVNMTNAFNRAAAVVGQKGTGAKTNSIFDPNAKNKRK